MNNPRAGPNSGNGIKNQVNQVNQVNKDYFKNKFNNISKQTRELINTITNIQQTSGKVNLGMVEQFGEKVTQIEEEVEIANKIWKTQVRKYNKSSNYNTKYKNIGFRERDKILENLLKANANNRSAKAKLTNLINRLKRIKIQIGNKNGNGNSIGNGNNRTQNSGS